MNIPVVGEKNKVRLALAILTGAPTILLNEINFFNGIAFIHFWNKTKLYDHFCQSLKKKTCS